VPSAREAALAASQRRGCQIQIYAFRVMVKADSMQAKGMECQTARRTMARRKQRTDARMQTRPRQRGQEGRFSRRNAAPAEYSAGKGMPARRQKTPPPQKLVTEPRQLPMQRAARHRDAEKAEAPR